MPNGPRGGSSQRIKHGRLPNGKPKFAGKDGQRQGVENPEWRPIAADTKARIDNRLLNRVALVGIVRVSGVSAQGLPADGKANYASQRHVTARPGSKTGG